MNVVFLMAGGVGKRFAAPLPKQYMILNGKPVIDYVIDAINKARTVDKVIVFADKDYIKYSSLLEESDKYHFVTVGKDRYESLINGFNYVDAHFKCDKMLVVDAAAPFLYPELIDDYFSKLDDYDAVITAQKITGALGNYKWDALDREDYYITQSPEAFKYELIKKYINPNAKTQELAWHLPKECTKYLNFNFKNNLKLTYNFELEYAKCLQKYLKESSENTFTNLKDESFFLSKGLQDYLYRIYPEETKSFLNDVYMYFKELENIYGKIIEVRINQGSRYGSVFVIKNINNCEYVVKVIPKFIDRYDNEKRCYKVLSNKYMCELFDSDDVNNSLILKKLNLVTPATFEDNIKLTDFFNRVFENGTKYDEKDKKDFKNFKDELIKKLDSVDKCLYLKEDIKEILEKALKYYNKVFEGKPLNIIHGDLRMNNILKDNINYYAIDPIGYVAPFVFETSRFIIDDIEINTSFDFNSRLELLLNYFSKWFNKKELLYSLYIFLAFITYNSTFEYENDSITKKYLKLLDNIENLLGD